jgi:pyridoxamine 5'-phosphate oxidase-like protein
MCEFGDHRSAPLDKRTFFDEKYAGCLSTPYVASFRTHHAGLNTAAVDFSGKQREFLEKQHSAAMITFRRDGTPVAVRVGVALVDGKLWSSGTQDRARTRWLRRDPRSTLFVFDASGFNYLNIECRVRILEGADAPDLNLRLFRVMQSRPTGPLAWFGGQKSEPEFLQTMRDEKRLIYEFEPQRVSSW